MKAMVVLAFHVLFTVFEGGALFESRLSLWMVEEKSRANLARIASLLDSLPFGSFMIGMPGSCTRMMVGR